MSSPESIVTSLDWSHKLKEVGFPQDDSLFIHSEEPSRFEAGMVHHNIVIREMLETWKSHVNKDTEFFAAPTAEEILRRLPDFVRTVGLEVERVKETEHWQIIYPNVVFCRDDSLANAAAAMWIYLKENNLLPQP